MFTKDALMHCIGVVADINHDMTPRQAFMTYSGHVEMISISVYPDGWKPNGEGGESTFMGWKDASGDVFYKDVENGVLLPIEERPKYKNLTDFLVAVRLAGKERL